jgi:uncharacterized protein with NRDE domain
MCLAVIALNTSPDWPLIIIANRDELHGRPTLPASPWNDATNILGGRDLEAGGTWLGMTTSGRIALLTNYREPARLEPAAPSRGQLTERFLRKKVLAKDYALALEQDGRPYNGFNLLVGDRESGFWFCSNRGQTRSQALGTGVAGLSNASINTPWPKLIRTKTAVAEHLSQAPQPSRARLFEIFQDTSMAQAHELPDTGLGVEREKLLSSPFIKNERYGTRCTTLIMQDAGGKVLFHEKRYNAQGEPSGESVWNILTAQQQILPI